MPLLDSDIAPNVVDAIKARPSPVKLVLGVAGAAAALAIGLTFLLAPKQTKKTVHQVVQAAQALVQKVAPAPAKADEEDESTPAPSATRRPRRMGGHAAAVRRRSRRTQLPPTVAETLIVPKEPVQKVELPLGTARVKVRETYGDPDLDLYKLEKDHEVEYFVYVNRDENYATSLLLVDGRLSSVFDGMPSVWSWR